jgi:hypothetical protein
MKLMKLAIAFLTAATTAALIATLCFSGFHGALMFPAVYFSLLLSVFVPVFLIALMHSLLLGVPAFIILLQLELIHLPSTLISAFIIGALPLTLLGVIFFGQLHPEAALFLGLLGASGGIVFWLLWRYWIQPTEKN